jgi:histidine triad (HIT) family protein
MTFLKTDIFAKIITGEIPCDKIFENERILAFRDIKPQAKHHILIIPKENYVTAMEITDENKDIFGELVLVAKLIAQELNLPGYKLAMNVGEAGGQIVPHVHLHLLSADYNSTL